MDWKMINYCEMTLNRRVDRDKKTKKIGPPERIVIFGMSHLPYLSQCSYGHEMHIYMYNV